MTATSFIKYVGFLWFCFAIYWYVCKMKNNCCFFCETALTALTIADYDTTFLTTDNHIQYEHSNNLPVIQKDVKKALILAAYYLRTHPYRTLTITGYYDKSESNPTDFDNLGLARADTIRQLLLDVEVPTDQLVITSIEKDDAKFYRNYIVKGNDFAFQKKVVVSKKIEQQLLNDTMRIHFNSGVQGDFLFNSKTHAYIDNVAIYLAQEPTATIVIIGHTDKVGSPAKNLQLGKQRAESIKKYLTRLSIKDKQIQTNSEGEDKPVQIGKPAENRRVELIVNNTNH